MKKLIAAAALALVASSSFAAVVVVAATGGNTATNTNCPYVPASNNAGVSLTKSANVAAVYECTSTGVITGAAHTQGKKKGFISTSAGGSQAEYTLSTNPSADTVDITTDSGMSGGWASKKADLT